MRWIVLISLFLAAPAHAEPAEEDVKKAIVQLGTAHLCAPIMSDEAPYEWAKGNLIDLVGSERANELISVMLEQDRDPGPLTERMCRNLTKNYRD